MWSKAAIIALLQIPVAAQITPAKEKELALGAALASEFRKHSTPVDDPRVEAIVQRLSPPDSGITWRVEAVAEDSGGPTHEPTIFPGGYLFVPSALTTSARGDSEVAGMLAHAMAHLIERHGFRQGPNGAVWVGAGPAMPLGLLREQRRFESEADRRAVSMLAAAGYEPAALRAYIARTQTDPENGLFSRWPVREVRLAEIDAALRDLPR